MEIASLSSKVSTSALDEPTIDLVEEDGIYNSQSNKLFPSKMDSLGCWVILAKQWWRVRPRQSSYRRENLSTTYSSCK